CWASRRRTGSGTRAPCPLGKSATMCFSTPGVTLWGDQLCSTKYNCAVKYIGIARAVKQSFPHFLRQPPAALSEGGPRLTTQESASRRARTRRLGENHGRRSGR